MDDNQKEKGKGSDKEETDPAGVSPSNGTIFPIGEKIYTVGENTHIISDSSLCIHVERPVFTQDQFDTTYSYEQPPVGTVRERLRAAVARCVCSGRCVRDRVQGCLPIIGIMRSYNVKKSLPSDVIAGLTLGVMMISQGMAFALLANVPPAVGLYSFVFPALSYIFLGTSGMVSVGPVAVISIMVGAAVDQVSCDITSNSAPTTFAPENYTTNGSSLFEAAGWTEEERCKIGVATAVTLLGGLIQILLGVVRAGFIATYFTKSLTRGYTFGVSIHVFTSQVRTILGLTKTGAPRHKGAFKLIKTYIDIFSDLSKTNVAALITSSICIVLLLLTKELLNPAIKDKIHMPFPIELLIVVGGTLASYYANFETNYNMTVVGFIPSGIPAPSVPPLDNWGIIFQDAIVMAIVGFAITTSIQQIYAQKYGYETDANQELYALGVANVAGSFFNCFMANASLSRSALQDSVGGRSQISQMMATSLMIIVLLFLGPLFKTLPTCALAAMIVVSLKNTFLQVKDLKHLAETSWRDFFVWVVTALATVILNVDLGLMVGLGLGLVMIVFRNHRPHVSVLGQMQHTDIYMDIQLYPTARELAGLKLFRMDAALYYDNAEYFMGQLYGRTVHPKALLQARSKAEATLCSSQRDKACNGHSQEMGGDSEDSEKGSTSTIEYIIIDCSTMGYVDSVGVTTLQQVMTAYKQAGVAVYLAACNEAVRQMLNTSKFYDDNERSALYLSTHDAVLAAMAARLTKKTSKTAALAKDVDAVSQSGASTKSHDQ